MHMHYIEVKKDLVKRIKDVMGSDLVSLVLFGSSGRKRSSSRSDTDLLVITKDVNDDLEREMSKIRINYLLEGVKIDIVTLSMKDAEENFKRPSPLFASLVLGFEVLYDTGFFQENFKEMVDTIRNSRITYAEEGKIWDLAKIASEISL